MKFWQTEMSMDLTRVPTYVRGLDEQLEGGIPQGDVILIAGKPGTMKSSLGFNILWNNAKQSGVPGAYVTLEQSRDSLLVNMARLGMPIEGLERNISILDLGMIRKKLTQLTDETWLEVFKMYVQNLRKNMNIELMVIDSLPVLEIMAKFKDPRDDLFHFFEWLRDLGVTTMLIAEMDQDSCHFSKNGEDFLADGIIHMDLKREGNNVNLYTSVVKMRKTAHRRGYYPVIYDRKGFEIVSE